MKVHVRPAPGNTVRLAALGIDIRARDAGATPSPTAGRGSNRSRWWQRLSRALFSGPGPQEFEHTGLRAVPRADGAAGGIPPQSVAAAGSARVYQFPQSARRPLP